PGPPHYQCGALPLSYASNKKPAGPAARRTTFAAAYNLRGDKLFRPLRFRPRHFQSLAKAVGAAEALKGEKYKRAIFNVKWGQVVRGRCGPFSFTLGRKALHLRVK